ncbi:thiamine phosphate synthase [Nesterenkonia sandarakina]|uniref:Thiamine-phosphate synthase n=1 Tax=Nesterenkonia sandarakina TaxID=272918 RepID=A0A7Z0J2Z1_9MICC|nr:thiamine phosphate synthase [Nesterenkonia sandarakina]NYJ16461.1 thiamine-phosphate pyrophosphorylase [Nesterenkonia sandarakina]
MTENDTMAHTPHPKHLGRMRRERLSGSRLYVCTDLQRFVTRPEAGPVDELDFDALREFYVACYTGGVDIIQVRDKQVTVQTEIAALVLLRQVADEYGGLSAANDRADVALITGVDVFHVGQEDLSTQEARLVLGDDVVIGRSCQTIEQVREADSDIGLDYYCTGPIWETPTKPGRAAVGLELPAQAARLGSRKTFFAIGGIDASNIGEVTAAGADRVVVVRAVTQASDPTASAEALRQQLPA